MVKQYREKDLCILEINEHRIVLSNPDIQPFNEFHYNSSDDILYFYYNIEIDFLKNYYIFTRPDEEREKEYPGIEKNWVKIINGSVSDFGVIQYLPHIIDKLLSDTPYTIKYPLYHHGDYDTGDYDEILYVDCDDVLCNEDVYRFKKTHRHFESSYNPSTKKDEVKDVIWYEAYFGIGNETTENSTGFMCDYLTEDELLVIKEWAESFMELSKEKTIKKIEDAFESDIDEYFSDPAWFKKHIQEKYPEDFNKWKEIWTELYWNENILEEYYKYVKGLPVESPLYSKWDNPITAKDFMDKGDKDWEAYLHLKDWYSEPLPLS